MIVKTSSVVAALVVAIAATPISRDSGSRIPITRRNNLNTRDGRIDYDRVYRQTVRDINKHRRNLMNIERNIGRQGFTRGARILPAAHYDHSVSLKKRQSANLTYDGDDDDNQYNQYYTGNISIGTPGEQFIVDFDTGSADIWVASVNCTSNICDGKNKYDPSQSSTASHQDATFKIAYADNSSADGPVYTDTVTVAGVTVTGQYFSPVVNATNDLGQSVFDGIVGLALPGASSMAELPFFFNAIEQHAVPVAIFGMKLAQNDSSLYLGGTDMSLYTGELEFHDVDSDAFWQISGASLYVGYEEVGSDAETIIDSGTSIIYGPEDQVEALYSKIEGAQLWDTERGLYSFPCNEVPDVAFNWGGANWTISADTFSLGKAEDDSRCIGAISGLDIGLGDNTWLLGDSFMKNVYTAFSVVDGAVGFAKLA